MVNMDLGMLAKVTVEFMQTSHIKRRWKEKNNKTLGNADRGRREEEVNIC